MVGWSSYWGSLIIYLLVHLCVAQFLKDPKKLLCEDDNLQILTAAMNSSQPKIPQVCSKSRFKDTNSNIKMTPGIKFVLSMRLLNLTLTANLILLSNDVSLNPGPGPSSNVPANMKGLPVCHLNICSLRNKLDELRLFCDRYRPHVLSLNETWLDNFFTGNEISLPGYNMMQRDRDHNGSGFIVYVNENLGFTHLENNIMTWTEVKNEAIWFELMQPKSTNISFVALYRPPNFDPSTFINNIEGKLASLIKDGIGTIFLCYFCF